MSTGNKVGKRAEPASESVKEFVVGDVHGNVDLLRNLLIRAGILNGAGKRVDHDTRVIQIGDLCNCVVESRDGDMACLDAAPDWLDVVLVGNHEYPYFGGPKFSGFFDFPEVGDKLKTLAKSGLIQPCVYLEGTLVTHAGVSIDHAYHGYSTAFDAMTSIENAWFYSRATDPVLTDIGYARGGCARFGGILWSDRHEPKNRSFPQIVGHTPLDAVTVDLDHNNPIHYIDVGGKNASRLAGVWVEGGKVTRTITTSISDAAEIEDRGGAR